MKVLLTGVTGDFKNNVGKGIQRYMYELYQNLGKLQSKEFTITKKEFIAYQHLGANISCLIQSSLESFSKFDIVHNLSPIFVVRNKFWETKYISIDTIHDFGLLFHPEYAKDLSSLKDNIWKIMTKRVFLSQLKSDYLIANSTQTKEEAILLGFDKNRIFVSNHGIDERYLTNKIHHKKPKTFIVGYIGALRSVKNLPFAIRAINYLDNTNVKFNIFGNLSSDYQNLKSLSKNKNISFQGFLPEEKLVETYDSFDAFVFPSNYEGFGLPILEAQARGLPVITYKYAKIPEEVTRYCFKASDPEHMAQIIQELKENGYDIKSKKRAMSYARTFTWIKNAKETLTIYNNIV